MILQVALILGGFALFLYVVYAVWYIGRLWRTPPPPPHATALRERLEKYHDAEVRRRYPRRYDDERIR